MIYLDHHAATPLVPGARAAIDRACELGWANPSSVHGAGRRARGLIEDARRAIARAIGARAADLVLTAGGSEACQLGIQGMPGVRRIVTTTIEHPAVARSIERLEASGIPVQRLAIDPVRGLDEGLDLDGETLVAIQWVSHELGIRLPVEAIARRARSAGARLFVDATQALGKLPIDVSSLGAQALAIASSKIGGPAGAGALWIEPGVAIEPVLLGGAQERGLRAGTPGVEAIAGFGGAIAELDARLAAMPAIAALREALERGLVARGAIVHAQALPRVATCTSASFPGRRGSVLVAALDLEGVAVSSGPACSSGLDRPSPSVLALHPEAPELAASTVRFSLGPETRADEIDRALAALDRVLAREARPG